MRHNKVRSSSFGLKPGPRRALIRNLVYSLVEHERIKTTLPRAWSVRRSIEKALTLGKNKNVASRRVLKSRYPHNQTVSKIMNQLVDRFKDRSGGCTRIIKLGTRSGDRAEMAYLEFVDFQEATKDEKKGKAQDKDAKKVEERAKKQIFLAKKKKKKHIRQIQKQSRRRNRP